MTQLLSLFNHIFGNLSKSNDLEQPMPSKALKAVKTINVTFLAIYDAWIEARLEQAKHYYKHSHIE